MRRPIFKGQGGEEREKGVVWMGARGEGKGWTGGGRGGERKERK